MEPVKLGVTRWTAIQGCQDVYFNLFRDWGHWHVRVPKELVDSSLSHVLDCWLFDKIQVYGAGSQSMRMTCSDAEVFRHAMALSAKVITIKHHVRAVVRAVVSTVSGWVFGRAPTAILKRRINSHVCRKCLKSDWQVSRRNTKTGSHQTTDNQSVEKKKKTCSVKRFYECRPFIQKASLFLFFIEILLILRYFMLSVAIIEFGGSI